MRELLNPLVMSGPGRRAGGETDGRDAANPACPAVPAVGPDPGGLGPLRQGGGEDALAGDQGVIQLRARDGGQLQTAVQVRNE